MSILNHFFDYKPEVLALDEKAMELCQPYFRHMEEIRDFNQLKMLKAFADTQMSSTDMLGTTGYGLWDTGRAKLEQIFAEVMGAEDALVRSQFQSGTHTLAVALFGLLRAGDTLLAATGRPYDTLEGVIGLDGKGKGTGTLMDYGIQYDEAPLKADFTPDYDLIAQKASGAKVCHIQRSRGYLQRNAFDLDTIRKIADTARAANPEIIIFVDNCYGEFTQTQEPCQVGADLVVGSLIKNPGGGIAPTGGYIAGRKDLVELCAYRLNAPGLGKELGCTLETPRDMYLGFYTLLAATGRPYDTLEGVIGLDGKGKGTGTLMDYGIQYDEAPLKADFTPDYDLIAQKASGAKVCHIQRSRGYLQRNAFDLDTIRKIADTARAANPEIIIFVDNCYGEFTQTQEPCQVGADLVVGSLIKNPGGGIAPTGGYIAGRKDLVELCAYRLNAPGLGKELGCTLETPRDMYLGFYYAPGVVCEAIKTAIYAQCMLELLGKNPVPRYCDDHNDIVTCFDAGTADALIGFCQGIQAASPVDSYAAPEPSPEPGYTDEVVMASGSFTQGSTIELSCDGPLREPYTCYLQGGLNFAASRAGVLLAIQKAYFKN